MLDRDVVIVSLHAAAGSEQTERVAVKQESRFVQANVTLQSINTAGLPQSPVVMTKCAGYSRGVILLWSIPAPPVPCCVQAQVGCTLSIYIRKSSSRHISSSCVNILTAVKRILYNESNQCQDVTVSMHQ